MDFLNKTFAQLSDLFRSMTPGARITSGLLLAAVLISLVYLFRFQVSSPDEDLMYGTPIAASQLPAMEAAFEKAGLTGYEVRGSHIRVPRGQRAKYMAALADAKALPPNYGSALREALDSSNVFESSKDKERRYKIGLIEELRMVISSLRGIESASVLLDVDTKGGLNREKIATASVTVWPVGQNQIDEETVEKIRNIVCGAVAGMKPENVTVSDSNGRSYRGKAEGGGDDLLLLTAKRDYERSLKQQILNALSYIPNITVEASVLLDRDRIIRTREIQRDPKGVTIRESEISSSRTVEGGGPGGRPGLQAQANTAASLVSRSTGPREESEESRSERITIPSGKETERETLGLALKRVSVAVGIPNSYWVKVWQGRNGGQDAVPDAAALDAIRQEESAKIQKHVAALLRSVDGGTDDGDPTDLVTVTTFQDIKPPELPEPPLATEILNWLTRSWQTLGLLGLAVVSLVMLRSMIRSVPAAPEASPLAELAALKQKEKEQAAQTADQSQQPGETPEQRRLRRFQTTGRSLRDELTELVREDPDTAANILKSWIGNVG